VLRPHVIERADLVVLAPAAPVAELLARFGDCLAPHLDVHSCLLPPAPDSAGLSAPILTRAVQFVHAASRPQRQCCQLLAPRKRSGIKPAPCGSHRNVIACAPANTARPNGRST